MIHHTSLYHTPDITASYTRHHCIIHQTSYTNQWMIQWCLVYDTVMSRVWYSNAWCMVYDWCTVMLDVQWCLVYDSVMSDVWASNMHDTPNMSHTRHPCIMHQTSLNHTPPYVSVSVVDLGLGRIASPAARVGPRLSLNVAAVPCSLSGAFLLSGVWYSDVWCVIQWCLVYDTVMSGVWYSGV